ncbi:dethiobiotin synthase [Marinobacter zhanjiangensis]|uniref:ATP-dependent dethiobiotin synthetase BioD n=1 Tax=Marinobacter zhanjiangensis TaxID=578215 RepID=A0ABQ3B689_9GAMM|nr:dethiobiotin synthase [Marinobacter zhanjiangensis]GGY75748.1 ATP-dependent dethiobiotin synthetase BioD [Marinobacter zhanjiangensis]
MARRTYFVTGTDTEVGKSVVSAAILRKAADLHLRTVAMKPVASGCEQTPDGLKNEDALLLMEHMTEALPYEQVNPIALEPAIAPHVAAAQAGRKLATQRLVGLARGLMMKPADLMLIEGAGGWRVPLNERETYARVPGELGLGVIIVVPLRLGCINHALLTAEAIRHDGLTVAGWVANRPDEAVMSCEEETLDFLKGHMGAPCLGVLPWLANLDIKALASQLDIEPLTGRTTV